MEAHGRCAAEGGAQAAGSSCQVALDACLKACNPAGPIGAD
jgi:hypothetical protein